MDNEFLASQEKVNDYQKSLALLNQSMEELSNGLRTRKQSRAKLLASVLPRMDVSSKLDKLKLEIEALRNDNAALEFELQERRCLKLADAPDANSFTGLDPHFNLKAELERSTPELLREPLHTSSHTSKKTSSVIGARKPSRKPKPLIPNHSPRSRTDF